MLKIKHKSNRGILWKSKEEREQIKVLYYSKSMIQRVWMFLIGALVILSVMGTIEGMESKKVVTAERELPPDTVITKGLLEARLGEVRPFARTCRCAFRRVYGRLHRYRQAGRMVPRAERRRVGLAY